MFRSVADGVREHPQSDGDIADAVRQAFATLLGELADAVRSYGDLVRAEVADSTAPAESAAAMALDALREARARVIELRLVEHQEDLATWELNDALLEAVERVLAELDVEEQTRRRVTRPQSKADPRAVLRAAQQGFRGRNRATQQNTRSTSTGVRIVRTGPNEPRPLDQFDSVQDPPLQGSRISRSAISD